MRYKIINGEKIIFNNNDLSYKILTLKSGINPDDLIKYGFEKKYENCYHYCLIGYLNYLEYDDKRKMLVQKVSNYDFQSDTEYTNADEIFDIIKNHNDFYWKKNNVVFNIELQELFEVRNG